MGSLAHCGVGAHCGVSACSLYKGWGQTLGPSGVGPQSRIALSTVLKGDLGCAGEIQIRVRVYKEMLKPG